jgi:hypothetical protein
MTAFVDIMFKIVELASGLYENLFAKPIISIPPFNVDIPEFIPIPDLSFTGIDLTFIELLGYGFIVFVLGYGIIKFFVGIITGS